MDRINQVTQDCFNAIVQIRQLDGASLPASELLHQRMCSFIDVMFQRAAQAGFSREDVNDIAYAVVALADEVVLAKSERIREYWGQWNPQ